MLPQQKCSVMAFQLLMYVRHQFCDINSFFQYTFLAIAISIINVLIH